MGHSYPLGSARVYTATDSSRVLDVFELGQPVAGELDLPLDRRPTTSAIVPCSIS